MMELERAPTPVNGDVVITRVAHSAPVWMLSSYPNEAQEQCRSYDEAATRARRYARSHAVDVFYTEDDGLTFSLIARHRHA